MRSSRGSRSHDRATRARLRRAADGVRRSRRRWTVVPRRQTGEIIRLSEGDDDELAEQIEAELGARYRAVPYQGSEVGHRDMTEFLATVTDNRLRGLLDVALRGKGAFRRFKDVLQDDPDERERWFAFQKECMNRRIRRWLQSEGSKQSHREPAPTDRPSMARTARYGGRNSEWILEEVHLVIEDPTRWASQPATPRSASFAPLASLRAASCEPRHARRSSAEPAVRTRRRCRLRACGARSSRRPDRHRTIARTRVRGCSRRSWPATSSPTEGVPGASAAFAVGRGFDSSSSCASASRAMTAASRAVLVLPAPSPRTGRDARQPRSPSSRPRRGACRARRSAPGTAARRSRRETAA